jgi:predicted Zn-dependent protease
MGWRAAAAAVTVFGATTMSSACSVNPATGEREIALIGEQQEIQMGREADQQIVATLGLYEDPELAAYVQSLGARLAASSERPDLPWTFRVIDDPTVNAFALPGGFVYVTRGIMTHLRSEAELVGVLGHEIGHITARHSVSQISRAQLAQLGFGLGMILVPELRPFGDVASVGLQLLFLSYGRDDEREADELGVRYMGRTSYDPRELSGVMSMLERSSEVGGGSGRVPEWLSTHPDPGNRATRIQQIVQESGADLSNALVRRNEYLRVIDGTVFGIDPREGFFRDNVFHHPELAFRFTFPRGWATANTKQAVQAVSPNQDAAMEVTLVAGSPSQALSQFGSQQTVQIGRTSQQSVNGLSAVLAEFAAVSDQGAFRGLVLFVALGGRTYRVLGYAPESRWSGHESTVHHSLGSFARETDPQVLAAQSNRLSIVQLERSHTLQSFLQNFPSAEPPEIVALINGLESGGSLPAGALAKRVVGGS